MRGSPIVPWCGNRRGSRQDSFPNLAATFAGLHVEPRTTQRFAKTLQADPNFEAVDARIDVFARSSFDRSLRSSAFSAVRICFSAPGTGAQLPTAWAMVESLALQQEGPPRPPLEEFDEHPLFRASALPQPL